MAGEGRIAWPRTRNSARPSNCSSQYYRTGDLKTWDDFNVAWVKDTKSTVDYILGFVEVYNDPHGQAR